MGKKSTTCMSKKSGTPLTEYEWEAEALDGADYANSTYGYNLEPYKCSVCEKYHLSPKGRHTPSSKCHYCTDSYNRPKELYDTYEGAQLRADILYQENRVSLRIYECPNAHGWHLTKSQ